jgi:hypothetical protein
MPNPKTPLIYVGRFYFPSLPHFLQKPLVALLLGTHLANHPALRDGASLSWGSWTAFEPILRKNALVFNREETLFY